MKSYQHGMHRRHVAMQTRSVLRPSPSLWDGIVILNFRVLD